LNASVPAVANLLGFEARLIEILELDQYQPDLPWCSWQRSLPARTGQYDIKRI